MFCLLETQFRINNFLLFELQVLIQIIQLVVESDKRCSLFVELILGSFVIILAISPEPPNPEMENVPAVYA